MTSSVQLFSYFSPYSSTLVETGTYLGDGVSRALQAGFKKVFSCEINAELVERARGIFDVNTVEIVHAPSEKALAIFLEKMNSRAVFFLDGHAMPESETSTVFGSSSLVDGVSEDPQTFSPLMVELGLISKHARKDHIILIDDRQCFDTWMFDFLKEDTVKQFVRSINPNYQFSYFDNVLCCYPKNYSLSFKIWFDQVRARIAQRFSRLTNFLTLLFLDFTALVFNLSYVFADKLSSYRKRFRVGNAAL